MSNATDDFFFGRLNHVSVNELERALGATSPVDTYGDRARSMFARITEYRKHREEKNETFARMYGKPADLVHERWSDAKDITVRELDEALQRVGWSPWPGLPVVIRDILTHREPEWHDGEVVKDADDVIWRNRFGSWTKFGCTSVFAPDVPKRPLKKIEV